MIARQTRMNGKAKTDEPDVIPLPKRRRTTWLVLYIVINLVFDIGFAVWIYCGRPLPW